MNKFFQTLTLLFTALSLISCGSGSGGSGGGGGGGGGGSKNLPTYPETEAISDMQNLNSTEDSLKGVGLKFKTDFDYNNGLATTKYSWDSTFIAKFVSENKDITVKSIDSALENYVKVVTEFIKKYSSEFILKKNDGKTENSVLLDSIKKELNAKKDLAAESISTYKAP